MTLTITHKIPPLSSSCITGFLEYHISPSPPPQLMLPNPPPQQLLKSKIRWQNKSKSLLRRTRCNRGFSRQQCPRMTSIHPQQDDSDFMLTFAPDLHLRRRMSRHRYTSCVSPALQMRQIYSRTTNYYGYMSTFVLGLHIHRRRSCLLNLNTIYI